MWNRLRAAVSRMVVGGSVRGGRDRRRQRQNWSTETVECRCLLSGSAIGDLVQTYPVTVQFSEFGRLGDARVFGDTLFIPGTRNDGAPIAWLVNLNTGVSETRVFAGSGHISGVIQRNGEFAFTGFLDTANGRKIAYWDDTGEHISNSNGEVVDVSADGRAVGSRGSIVAHYYDVGASSAVELPGIGGLYFAASSITDDGRYIGGRASDMDLNASGIVYELQTDGSYVLLGSQFLTQDGLSLDRLDVVESSIGVLGVGVYADLNSANHTGLWKLDGTYLADVGIGFMAGAKSVGNYMFVATDAGNVTAIDLGTFETQSFTGNALFGTSVEFMPGSVFATEDGNLGLIGRNPVTGFLTVKTFEVLQNTAPVVSAWDGTTSFVENSLPVVLDANVSVVDADSSDFAGGTVTVSFAANGTAADRLSVRHVGNSAGQIGVSGIDISFGGVLIGTTSGGTNGSTPLVVTLNAAANSSAVTALLRAISFQNVSESPSTAARRVQVVVADGDGGTSAAVSKLVTVTAVNDAPASIVLSSVSTEENRPVGSVIGTFTATDPDSTGPFTYSLVAGTGSTDNARFSISGTALKTAAIFDYETTPSFSIRVRVTDPGGAFFESTFTVNVTNKLDGTSGSDAFVLRYFTSSVSITMSVNGGTPISQGSFPLTSPVTLTGLQSNDFVRVVGTGGNDVFAKSSAGLTVNGAGIVVNGPARMTLAGGAGSDVYRFDADAALGLWTLAESGVGTDTIDLSLTTTVGLSLNLGIASTQVVHPTNLSLNLSSSGTFENIIGGSGNDILTGNALANVLNGNAGNDTLNGAAGNDTLLGGLGDDSYIFAAATAAEADTLTEGAGGGVDTISFATVSTPVTFSLATGAVQSVHTNRTVRLNSTIQFENAAGGSAADTLTGNTVANILIGNAGGDILNGLGGRDILIGGLGLDRLNGGDGEDILIAGRTASDALFSSLNCLQQEWTSGNSYTTRITNLRAGVGSPAVSLKAKVNVRNDAGEDDSLIGGNNLDWYFRALDDIITGLAAGEVLDVL